MYTFASASIITLLVSASSVTAMDVCSFTTTCSSQVLCCANIPNNVCCSGWPGNFGFSIQFFNPPTGVSYIGAASSDASCSVFETSSPTVTGNFCSTNTCGPFGDCSPIVSAGWVLPGFAAGRNSSLSAQDAANTDCVLPNMIRFEDAKGVKHQVRIPEGSFEKAAKLLAAQDFDGLPSL